MIHQGAVVGARGWVLSGVVWGYQAWSSRM